METPELKFQEKARHIFESIKEDFNAVRKAANALVIGDYEDEEEADEIYWKAGQKLEAGLFKVGITMNDAFEDAYGVADLTDEWLMEDIRQALEEM
jgi:hypothetical protein